MPSDWTRGLSKQQLAVIQQDTRDFERRHPEQRQDHVHRDMQLNCHTASGRVKNIETRKKAKSV